MKNISQSVISRKRPLEDDEDDDDDDDCEVYEIIKPRKVVSKYPPPKMRNGVQIVRDFPRGCGIIDRSLENKPKRIPSKDLDNDDSKIRKMTSIDNDKLSDSRCFENDKFRTSKPMEFGGNMPSCSRPTGKVQFRDPISSKDGNAQKPEATTTVGPLREQFRWEKSRRPVGKVKFYDPRLEEVNYAQKPKDTTIVESQKEQARREKIIEAMTMFDEVYEQLSLENKSKPKGESIDNWRVTIEAAKIVLQRKKLTDTYKTLGHICGIQIGDKFKYRAQLHMVGLHCQQQSGIDYANFRGKNLAISIVDSQRYSNERESCDVLFYSGHGGGRRLSPEDQKLERGNMALKNSMNEKTPVRVIRKLYSSGWRKNDDVFVYDGLYIVKDYKQQKGEEGKMVFMFQLKRINDQPQLHKMLSANR